jgi:hypothetical protein
MKMKTKCLLGIAAIAAIALSAPVANAAVVVTNDTGTTTTVDDGSSTATFSSWSLNGGNTVAVFFGGEALASPSSAANLTGATYDGQTMSIVQETSGDRWTAAIAYLINPTATIGDIVLTWASGDSEIGYTPFALGGVGGVAGSDSNDDGSDLNFAYTTSLDGGYVLGAASNNQWEGAPLPNVSGNAGTVEDSGAISGNSAYIFAHGDVATAGGYTDIYSDDVESAASVAFNAVPEPSSFALIAGCFGLAWVMLRRRG